MVKKIHDRSTNPGPNELAQTTSLEVPRLLTTAEAAHVLGLRAQTLSIWRCKKRYGLRFVKMGGAVRYLMADLVKFLEASAVTPTALRKPAVLRRSTPRRPAKPPTSF
jgi:hypothetical protein